jgi:type IV secretion system protein TrbL
MKIRGDVKRGLLLAAIVVASVSQVQAQVPDTGQSNMVFTTYAQAATQWITVAQGYAKTLFGLLAVIDFSWTAGMLALEGHELNTYIARIIRKLMTISFFAVILANGTFWMGAISASFIKIGQAASGTNVVTPAQIIGDGFSMAGILLQWATKSATTIGLTSVAPMVPVLFALIVAILLLAGYAIVAINFVVTTIEGFVVIGAGYIFLGFGGSQWTRPYVERYIALAVSLGARLMILYMIVGLGHTFATQWVAILNNMTTLDVLADPTNAFMNMCGILCGAATYAGVAVLAPRLVGSIMSGSLSFSGNEALSMGSGAALGAAAVLAAVPTGGGSLAAAGGAGTLAAGSTGAAGAAASSTAAASTTSMGLGTAVAPPATSAASGGGSAAGSTMTGGGLNVPPPTAAQATGTSTAGQGSVAPPPLPTSGASSTEGVGSVGAPPSSGASTGATAPSTFARSGPSSVPDAESRSGSPSAISSAQQAKGGVERIIGATQIGSSEAPPPRAHIEGSE